MAVHPTRPVRVWADIDEGIAPWVEYLQTFHDVRTHGSCQGTIGEGGADPYAGYILASWPPDQENTLLLDFTIEHWGDGWGRLYPKGGL